MPVPDKRSIRDIFEWDVINWSRALRVWEPYLGHLEGKHVLTTGEMNGGMTLLCSLYGAYVTCTDVTMPREAAQLLHKRYGTSNRITYEQADFTSLPYSDHSFDFVVFKSVLCALMEFERQKGAIAEARRVLRPGGMLLFVDNLRGSDLHMALRGIFSSRLSRYRYMPLEDTKKLLEGFHLEAEHTWGVAGLVRMHPAIQTILSYSDRLTEKIVPPRWHYIYAAACRKPKGNE